MSKIWAFVLIIVAILGLGAGTYWYFQLRGDTEQIQERPIQVAPDAPRAAAQAAVSEEPAVIETLIPTEVVDLEPLVSEPVAIVKEEVSVAPAEVIEPPKLISVEIEKQRIPSMPMPHPTAALVAAGLLTLPSHVPSVPLPFAPPPRVEVQEKEIEAFVMDEPAVEDLEDEELVSGETLIELDEIPEMIIEPEISDIVVAEQENFLTLIPTTPPIPTSRVEVDPRPLTWTVGTSVSFTNFQWPSPVTRGFDVQASVYHHTQMPFSYGAIFEFAKPFNASEYQFSALGSLVWTLNEDKDLQFPLTIAFGPTLIFNATASTDIAMTLKAMAGISYQLTEQISFFYQAGLQTRFNISKSAVTFSLEPMRVGFNFRF